MPYNTVTLTNQDPRFYPAVGPFLGRREVHQYLDGELWDEDDKTWILATDDSQHVAGFIGLRTVKGLAHLESLYVLPDHEDAACQLLAAAMAAVHPTPMRTVVRRDHAGPHLAAGFTTIGETKNFLTLIKGTDR